MVAYLSSSRQLLDDIACQQIYKFGSPGKFVKLNFVSICAQNTFQHSVLHDLPITLTGIIVL